MTVAFNQKEFMEYNGQNVSVVKSIIDSIGHDADTQQ